MNKQDYMFRLENSLAEFDQDIRDEIMSDYEEHFEMGALEGKSEEKIAEELGSIEELVMDLRAMKGEAGGEAGPDRSFGENFKNIADRLFEKANELKDAVMNGVSEAASQMRAKKQQEDAVESGKCPESKECTEDRECPGSRDCPGSKEGEEVAEAVEDAVKEAEEMADDMNKKASDFSEKAGEKVSEIMKNFATVIGEMAAGIAKQAGKMSDSVGEGTKDFATNFVSGVTKGYENLAQGVGDFADKVSEKTGKFVREVSDSYHRSMNKEAGEAASKAGDLDEVFENAADKLKNAVSDAEAAIDELVDTDFELDDSTAGKEQAKRAGSDAQEAAQAGEESNKDSDIHFDKEEIKENLKSTMRDLGTALGSVIDGMKDAISGIFGGDEDKDAASGEKEAAGDKAGSEETERSTAVESEYDEDDPDFDDDDEEESSFAAFSSDVESIVIEANGGEIIVDANDDEDELTFNYTNEGTTAQKLAYKFDLKQVGRTVYASIKRKPGTVNFFNSLNWPDTELYVGLSSSVKKVSVRTMSGEVVVNDAQLDQLDINSMSGDVEITDAKVVAADISTMSGDIDLTDCEFGALSISSVSGDTDLVGSADSIHSKTTSGDVEYELSKRADITGSSVSGDITVRFEDCSGYVANVSTTSGNITLCLGEEERAVIRSGNYILGDGDSKLKLSSVSGDLVVEG